MRIVVPVLLALMSSAAFAGPFTDAYLRQRAADASSASSASAAGSSTLTAHGSSHYATPAGAEPSWYARQGRYHSKTGGRLSASSLPATGLGSLGAASAMGMGGMSMSTNMGMTSMQGTGSSASATYGLQGTCSPTCISGH